MKKVIVIGAGILGATTAYHLSKLGAKVIIIDRNDIGQATQAAAGIIGPWLTQRRNKAWYTLAKNGAKYYPELISDLHNNGEENTGYQRVGMISLHTDEKKLKAAEKRVLERKKDAPEIGEITLLNDEKTLKLFPLLNPRARYHSIHISGAARVDGGALCHALIRSAVKHGAKIINGNAELLWENKKIIGVQVNNDHITADTVVATTGAWISELFKPLGINLAVTPQKAQIVHLQVLQTNTNSLPVVMPPNNQYILAFDEQRIVIGATHESSAGFDTRVTARGVHEVLSKALEVAPGLENSTLLETKVGFRPYTPGSLPIIGPLPGYDGLLMANGLGASGLTTGPFIGLQLAKLALNMNIDIDLNNYHVAGAIQ